MGRARRRGHASRRSIRRRLGPFRRFDDSAIRPSPHASAAWPHNNCRFGWRRGAKRGAAQPASRSVRPLLVVALGANQQLFRFIHVRFMPHVPCTLTQTHVDKVRAHGDERRKSRYHRNTQDNEQTDHAPG
jgi:hypothetical protein